MNSFHYSTSELPKIIRDDPLLYPYRDHINRRLDKLHQLLAEISGEAGEIGDFSSAHMYYGLHFHDHEWVFREWAPNASRIYLVGPFSDWQESEHLRLQRLNHHGDWEIRLPATALQHQDLYRLSIYWPEGQGDRIPVYTRRVVQDEHSKIFNAQIWHPETTYKWKYQNTYGRLKFPLIYEAHIGMSLLEGRVGTYREFMNWILPKIVAAGYNTIQLMAVQEHPYYGSFGYHVSNFFAASSRFGTPDELKELIDEIHHSGLAVIIDIVHSHAVKNEVEGISRFDGTDYQYFHTGPRGLHAAWDSRCFDYGKKQVLHFLLSNCRFWLDEYHVDGFRFDGVTSMLYHHHGLYRSFNHYDDYFGKEVDEDAWVYLALANTLIHTIYPHALTIAEDMSGMPGIAISVEHGGIGFDYRLGMGIPDYWVKLVKHVKDEFWHVGDIWNQLNNRRAKEKTISYVESHDQALVGDQTLIFRLIGNEMYLGMQTGNKNLHVDRGIALHKMIRLITLSAGGDGYLNFMGNEFGHPEWIDFPREGNNWSYDYARRQWNLRYDPNLYYYYLAEFDRDLIMLARKYEFLTHPQAVILHEHVQDQVLAYQRANLIFIFNFSLNQSYTDYRINLLHPDNYQLILNTDDDKYAGHHRLIHDQKYCVLSHRDGNNRNYFIQVYLPTRTGLVMHTASEY